MITGEIKGQVDKIWESFWTGGVSNPMTVNWTIYLFAVPTQARRNTIKVEEKSKYDNNQLTFTAEQQKWRWSSFKNIEPQAMFDLFTRPSVRTEVFEHMKEVGSEVGVFAKYMKELPLWSYPRLLDQVVQTIDKIKMEDRDTRETSMNTYSHCHSRN
jgi:type I restriction enzyme M protein